jgi:hypothetical protein
MGYQPPTHTDDKILASTEAHARHWEEQALREPEDVAFWCRNYAQHLRVLAELFKLRRLDEAMEAASRGQVLD